jgi:hypothetical protein
MRCRVLVRVPSWGRYQHPWESDLSADQVAYLRDQYGVGAVRVIDPDVAPAETSTPAPAPAPAARRPRARR